MPLPLRLLSQTRIMSSIAATKKAWRQAIKERLTSLSPQEIETQSAEAQTAVLDLAQYRAADSLSVYLSMPSSEAQTSMIIEDAFQRGKIVFVPYLFKASGEGVLPQGRAMDMMRLRSLEEYHTLVKDRWGIPTLPSATIGERENAMGGNGVDHETTSGALDLMIMPGVAFDASAHRLGHGAGYYDSYLSRYTSHSKKPFLGAPLFQCLILR